MKKNKKKFIILLVCVGLIVFLYFYFHFSIKKETSILSNTIEEKVSKLLELSIVKYNYTDVIAYKNNKKFKGINLPFTNKSFLIKYSGYLKAGVDLKNIELNVKDNKSVQIKLDKPIIFDNVINEEDVYIYDEQESIFNKLSYKNLYDVLVKEKGKIEKEIIKKGFLNECEKKSQELIFSFLESMGFKDIKIVFR